MTLLVAAKENDCVWMVADTAITGGKVPIQSPVYRPKLESAHNRSIIGYAGDSHFGEQYVRAAKRHRPGEETVAFLLDCQTKTPSVDFAYSYIDKKGPKLFRISDGHASEVETLYLGDNAAFNSFQNIRHSSHIDHAPDSIHTFIIGADGDDRIPDGLQNATAAMLYLFPTREDHSVGGWPVPYLLTSRGAQLCSYAYSVTGPITNTLKFGSIFPHGTASEGAYSLSINPLRERDGMVVYWLQGQRGRLYIRDSDWYSLREFQGDPATFKDEVFRDLSREVDVWFGGGPAGAPEKLTYLRDQDDGARIAVVQSGNSFSFSWIRKTDESFRIDSTVNVESADLRLKAEDLSPAPLSIVVAADQRMAKVGLKDASGLEVTADFDAATLDKVIGAMAQARMGMTEAVPNELEPGKKMLAATDPAWRTRSAPHPDLPGPILALRHPGYGWVGFVLPIKEALALGSWLVTDAEREG